MPCKEIGLVRKIDIVRYDGQGFEIPFYREFSKLFSAKSVIKAQVIARYSGVPFNEENRMLCKTSFPIGIRSLLEA